MSRIGFIGLGIMGKPMAGHLAKAGDAVHVHSRTYASVAEFAALGAIPCKNPKEVAERSEIVFLMLPDTPDVEEVPPQAVLKWVTPQWYRPSRDWLILGSGRSRSGVRVGMQVRSKLDRLLASK